MNIDDQTRVTCFLTGALDAMRDALHARDNRELHLQKLRTAEIYTREAHEAMLAAEPCLASEPAVIPQSNSSHATT